MLQLLINIDVDDLERATAFYTNAFDLRQGRRLGDDCVELVGGSSKVYLLRRPAGTSPIKGGARDYARHWTPVHVDFIVEGNLEAAVERARAAGAVVERPIATHAWGSIATLVDPFGHGLCLLRFSSEGYDAIASGS